MQRVGEIALTAPSSAPMAIAPPQEKLLKCLELLNLMGEMRQSSISAETQAIYAAVLATYDLRHLEAAVMRLGRAEREAYEKAIPELGELEAMVKREERKEILARRGKFVPCGKCVNGVLRVNDKGQPWRDSIDHGKSEIFARDCDCLKAWRAL